ncbi:MAG TPA: UDP-3-O-(3-hydroxymyristoyl)glucosamine N-acyltransferase [Deltaproteobacteria bacterium]|nr:UDP-3-O-(3-hydroxymyristoyl)glucosamine N-acyltransferase [Deltaproteobacteria bacterium]
MTEDLVDFGYEKVPEKEKALRVKDHFDRLAQNYDAMNTLMSFGIHYLWKRAAVRFLDLKAGNRVLDVCGGTGDLTVLAVKKVGLTGKVVLSDINLAMIEAGKRKATNAGARGRVLHVQSDAEQMAFRSNSFNAAMAGFGMRNLTHMDRGLREVHRLLKPGGRFVCLEFSRPASAWFRSLYDLYSFRVMPFISLVLLGSRRPFTYLPQSIRLFPGPEEFSEMLAGAGFQNVSYRLLTNGIAAVHRGEKAPDLACGNGLQGVRQ